MIGRAGTPAAGIDDVRLRSPVEGPAVPTRRERDRDPQVRPAGQLCGVAVGLVVTAEADTQVQATRPRPCGELACSLPAIIDNPAGMVCTVEATPARARQ